MPSLARDLRLAFRSLRRAPGFATVTVLTMALAVGATSAIFSIANGLLLNGLPWRDPETIVNFELRNLKRPAEQSAATPAHYHDWKQQARSFDDLVATRFDMVYLTDRDEPYLALAPRTTTNAFALFGIEPLLGRAFHADDGRPGARPVIMLTEQLWADRYGAEPNILGRSVEVNGVPTTVIGVIAAARWFPVPAMDVVLPLDLDASAPSRTDAQLGISARLRPGVSLAQAQAEMDGVMQRLSRQYPETDGDFGVQVYLTRDRFTSDAARRGVYLLMGAVGFVLLIAGANLANLLRSRAASRKREIATRAALGATRAQIVAQLLSECAALGLIALPLALLITRWSLDYFLSLTPADSKFLAQFFRMDGNVVGFAAVVTAVTVLMCGLSPALKASKVDLSTSLMKCGGRGATDRGSHGLHSALVVTQIGLALSLVIVATLFMLAFSKLNRVDPGFELGGAMATTVVLPEAGYRDADALRAFHTRLPGVLHGLPGAARAAVASSAPLGRGEVVREFQIAGRRTAVGEEEPRASWASVSSNYFATVGLRLIVGRGFTRDDDASGQAVAVVSRAFAERFFPGQDPVGQHIEFRPLAGIASAAGGTREIVGVVSDIKVFGGGLAAPRDGPFIYEAVDQQPVRLFSIVVRAQGNPLAVVPALRQRIKGLDPRVNLANVETMPMRFERSLWQGSFFAKLMDMLGGLALVLAAVGVYGVVAYATARRTREFGIRAALGAAPTQIAAIVLRRTIGLAGAGVALGLVLGLLFGRGIQNLLYETSGHDPRVLFGGALLLCCVAFAASMLPALRAIAVEPSDCLRME